MNFKFLDLERQYQRHKDELDEAYHRVMDSGWYVGGEEVEAFEKEWADRCGTHYCVGVSSGQSALYLALMAVHIGFGDEVIVPSNTYIATWLAVSQTGAEPIPVEPDRTFCIDPDKIEAAITPRTRAIMPVHLYGMPASMKAIQAIAFENNLVVINDCAQAHGARYMGKDVGGLGHLSAFSFYPAKNLGAYGDAGAVTTHVTAYASRLRRLRNHGSDRKHFHDHFGINARLDPLQAAFLRAKIPYLDEMNKRRREIADRYRRGLFSSEVTLPWWGFPERHHVFHQFVIHYSRRYELFLYLEELGVPTMFHYPTAPHKQKAYESFHWNLPIAERLAQTCLSLPIDPGMTDDEVDQVIDGVRSFK